MLGNIVQTIIVHESSEYAFERGITEAITKLQRLNLVVDPINISTTERGGSHIYFTTTVVGREKE